MSNKVFATKGNLMSAKKSIVLAQMGYDLMDRKRNILIREMMSLIDKVKLLRDEITESYATAYLLLQQANVSSGLITNVANQVPLETGIKITYRSVMGVVVPNLIYDKQKLEMPYGITSSSSKIDEAYIQFNRVKELTIILAEVDNSVYRLANAIRKTQKRANALHNVVIPNYHQQIKYITDALEEKEREEFSRLKVIKKNNNQGIL